MTPDLILFGINSIIRLGAAGAKAADQAARDADALFPLLRRVDFDASNYINSYFLTPETRDLVTGEEAAYSEHWNQRENEVIETPIAVDTLLMLSIKIETAKGNEAADPRKRGNVAAGALMVAQWRDSEQPLNPWIGVMLTAADIGLEYVSVNPGLLDLGTQGDAILSAYAKELAALLPDDGNFGTQHGFGQRLGASFLKAGLSAVAANPSWLTDEEHLQQLLKNSIKPLVDAFPAQSLMTQLTWRDLGDVVMGPVAAAAFETVANNQAAFLGNKFDTDQAVGAVTRAVFLQVADTGIQDQFSRDGLVELTQAVFQVVADKPGLFVGDNEGRTDELARALVSDLAGMLAETETYDRRLARQLAGTAISTVGTNAYRFQKAGEAWHKVATDLVISVSRTLSEAIVSETQLEKVLSQEQLIELGRIVIRHIGESPGLVLNNGNSEWSGVISAVATGMLADDNLLLGGEAWLQIASLAAEEAARNPARLFSLEDDQVLAGELIKAILEGASEILAESDRSARSVLYGATLHEAIQTAIRAAAGNAAAVKEHLLVIKQLVSSLNAFVADNHEMYGSKEWLHMFGLLLPAVLDGASLPELSNEIAEDLLKKGVA